MKRVPWRYVWITGAGRGIGAALTQLLVSEGANVYVSARSQDELTQLANECAELKGKVIPLPLDVTQPQDVQSAVAAFDDQTWPELVVLNAGTYQPFTAQAFDATSFLQQVDVNVAGTVHCLAPILKQFVEQNSGHIAVMASVAGYRGLPTAAAYGATKAALINMCEALRLDLQESHVKLQVINPGFVRTPLTDKNTHMMPVLLSPEEAAQRIVAGLGRDQFEITFPKRFTYFLKSLRVLPYRSYFAVVGRLLKSKRAS